MHTNFVHHAQNARFCKQKPCPINYNPQEYNTLKVNTGQHTGLALTQEQKQIQTTTAVQVMLSAIMEMPLADLEQHVNNELESNEALEQHEPSADTYADDDFGNTDNDEIGIRNSHTTDEDYDEFVTIDQVPEDMRGRYNDQLSRAAGGSRFDGDREGMIADTGATSYDDIKAQIGELDLTEEEEKVMEYLVGSLDERGYLTKDNQTLIDELTFQEYIYIDEPQLQRIIDMLQSFEPRGIGARNMQDCLLLQMRVAPEERRRLSLVGRLAYKVVRDMWEELSHSRWKKIQDALDVDDDTITEIQHVIHRLNPKPGSGLNEATQSSAPRIIADFNVMVDDDGELTIFQNRGSIPELRVSNSFAETVNAFRDAQERARAEGRSTSFSRSQEEAYKYASHKVEEARAFIESLQRRHNTLQAVMKGIVRLQRDFFTSDDDENLIHPMKLQDVADLAGVDISTVSRAANSKYVQTKYGTYPLKHFFGSEFVNTEGDSISQRRTQLAIKEIIESEDPRHPYSDQRITEILAEQGTVVARRTVAKYRERMGYARAALRRR